MFEIVLKIMFKNYTLGKYFCTFLFVQQMCNFMSKLWDTFLIRLPQKYIKKLQNISQSGQKLFLI